MLKLINVNIFVSRLDVLITFEYITYNKYLCRHDMSWSFILIFDNSFFKGFYFTITYTHCENNTCFTDDLIYFMCNRLCL